MGMAVRTLLSPRRWPILKTLLVLLNIMATWLTVWLGLRESPLVAWATGRHDTMRQRLLTGGVTTEIAELKHFRLEDLEQPKQLADYTFFWTPRRDPSNIGESRTVCLTMNTNTAPSMMLNFDDYWGRAARRVQIRINSISAPYCQVLNAKPAWRDQCVKDNQGNATLCHQFVLDNFDNLRKNFTVRMAVVKDIGSPGVPFLRCESRPLTAFKFKADLLAYQTYWSGSDYFLSIQTSDCMAMPLARTKDRTFALFQTVNVDEACEMLYLLPTGSWLTELVRWAYSLVTVVLIIQGIALGLFRTNTVNYLPHGLRIGKKSRWLRFALPFMELITRFSDNDRSIVTFKGSMLVVSDVWMTNWLYIWLSILEALVCLRATYVTYQVATSLLVFKFTLGNLVFLCTALIKITWLVCLVQTIVRLLIKLAARCLRAARLIRSVTREKMEWNADGISILLSYRVYYVMMFILTFVLIKVKGDPSFMQRAALYKTPAYGGVEDLAGFWGSELACDLVTLIGILTVISQVIGAGLMYTRFKHVADNGVMRLLQRRYFFSGWDGLLAAQMLGLDPSDPTMFVDGRAYTKFTIGALLQLLYQSGPSGFVHLAGDYIFHDNGFSRDPVRFKYAIPKAMGMGILNTGKGSVFSTGAPNGTEVPTAGRPQGSTGNAAAVAAAAKYRSADEMAAAQAAKRSIFERRLRIASESYLGKLLFIDTTQPGQLTTNKETGHREYEVIDAMTTMTILDIKYLMGKEKKIRVE